MAFKFTKDESNTLGDHKDVLRKARVALDEKVEETNQIIEDALGDLNAAVTSYNESLEAARGFLQDVHDEREGEFSERSESWQDGDRGIEAQAWLESLDTAIAELEDASEFTLDQFNLDELIDAENTLNEVPEEAS